MTRKRRERKRAYREQFNAAGLENRRLDAKLRQDPSAEETRNQHQKELLKLPT